MIDFLRSLFFESLPLLLVVEAVAFAVAVAIHRQRLTKGSRRGLLLTILVCLALLVLQFVVVTDRERVEQTVAIMARAIDDGDVPTLGENLDASFVDQGLNKQNWLADVRQRLQRWRIDEAKVGSFNTKVDGDTAVAAFNASCDWRSGEQSEQSINSAWKLQFVRTPDGWKLQKVLSAKFGPGGLLDYTTIRSY